MRLPLFALVAVFAGACTTEAPPPPPVFVPMVVPGPQATPAPTSTTSTTPKPKPPKPPKPPPEPIPPAPEGARPDLLARDVDLVGEVVTFDLVNRGGDALVGFAYEVVVANANGEGRTLTVDQSIPGGISGATTAPQRVRMPGLDVKFPRLATEGGQLEVRVTVDTGGTVDETDEANNAATAVLRIDAPAAPVPVVEAPAKTVPPPVAPPPPAAPTTASITFRRSDEAWANIWVDGNKVFEPKNFEKEKTITLKAGAHRLKSEDFMGSSTWSEGTLTVVGGQDLVIGFAEGQAFDVYSDPGAFKPL